MIVIGYLQQMHQFEGYCVVDMDDILDSRHQEVTSVTKQAHSTFSDRKLLKKQCKQIHGNLLSDLEEPHVINEEV